MHLLVYGLLIIQPALQSGTSCSCTHPSQVIHSWHGAAGRMHLLPQLLRVFPRWAPWGDLAANALPRALWWLLSCSLASQLASSLFPDQ